MAQTITVPLDQLQAPAAPSAPVTVPLDQITPDFRSSNEKDAAGDAVVDPNTIGTFAKHFAAQVNPIPLGQLLPFPKALGGAGMDAIQQAAKNLLHAQQGVLDQADAARKRGDYVGAFIHYMNWALPVFGPILDKAGNEIRAGRFAAGAGDSAGLAASLFGGQAFQAAKDTVAAAKLADAAEEGARARAVETMAPQVGPNKVRFGNMAADVGPQVLKDTSAVTRGGLLDQASTKLDNAYSALDAAYDAVPNTRMYPTKPIVAGLQREIQRLSVSGIGGTVEPATRASRIASLRQAADEIQGLGPLANIDNLRKMRIAWDEGAKAQFTPAVAQDFLKARGTGAGWADARSVLNDFMVSQHPELSPLNADASLWKKAVDVLQAAEEADRVRPKVGQTIMARGLGAAVGGSTEGGWGAAAGAIVGPTLERAMSNLHPSVKILVGRQMANLADAIRTGNASRATSLIGAMKALIQPALTKAGQVASGQLVPTTTQIPTLAQQGAQ